MAKKAFDLKDGQLDWVNEVLEGHKHELNQSQILIEALSDWALKKEAGGAIANAPDGYKNMFSGDKDKLLSALDMIRSTYVNLMVVTSEKLEEQEKDLKELFGARIRELGNEKEALENKLQEAAGVVKQAEDDVKAAEDAKQKAIDDLKIANEMNSALTTTKDELENDKKNLEADKTALLADKNTLNQTIVEKDAEIKKLKALETTNATLEKQLEQEKVKTQLKDKEIEGYQATIKRLEKVEGKYDKLRDEQSAVIAQKAAAEALATDRKKEIEALRQEITTERQKAEAEQAKLAEELSAERQKVEDLYKQLNKAAKTEE